MTKRKITQKEAIFYKLYQAYKEERGKYIPVFEFMGEIYAKEVDLWGYVSHECSARCSELKTENPQLIQSTVITGKSGAKYYGYRIDPLAKSDAVFHKNLHAFYKRIKRQPSLV
jgi:hypothetical protein